MEASHSAQETKKDNIVNTKEQLIEDSKNAGEE